MKRQVGQYFSGAGQVEQRLLGRYEQSLMNGLANP